MNFILYKKLKYYTKETLKYFSITILAFGFIMGILFIKFKPMYKVSISGTELGYVQNKEALEEKVKESIMEVEEKNIDSIEIQSNPEYALEFVDRTIETKEQELIDTIKQDVTITYKYYEIALNNEQIISVDTMEEAEELVDKVKEENQEKELDLSIIEKYTEKVKEVNTEKLEIAQNTIQTKVTQKLKEIEEQKAEEERIKSMPEVNGIKLAYIPISGTITSRYGVSSSVRSSDHTGLDIAASTGTPIKVVASGTVTFASEKGSYGNVVKVNHGNGIETWYAHTSKMYVSEGEKVEAGSVIAAVGSTGNSTGPHLHFELRINGQHVNPQKYLYNK